MRIGSGNRIALVAYDLLRIVIPKVQDASYFDMGRFESELATSLQKAPTLVRR